MVDTSLIDIPPKPYWCLIPTESTDFKDWLNESDNQFNIKAQEYLKFYSNNKDEHSDKHKSLMQDFYENPNRKYIVKLILEKQMMQPITITMDRSDILRLPSNLKGFFDIVHPKHVTMEVTKDLKNEGVVINIIHESLKKE